MTEQSKPKIENLELNKETLRDLADSETEHAQGGAGVGAVGVAAITGPVCSRLVACEG